MPIKINDVVTAPSDFQAFFGIGLIKIQAGAVGKVFAVDLLHNEAGIEFETCCWCPINLIEVQHEFESGIRGDGENVSGILGDSAVVTRGLCPKT